MDSILVKIFATAFALGEVLTHPQVVRTHLDPATDQDKVVQVLRAGCDHMRRVFDIESSTLTISSRPPSTTRRLLVLTLRPSTVSILRT